MLETPSVIVNSTDTEKTASVKQIHSNDTQIYEFSMLLARGDRNLFYVWSMLQITSTCLRCQKHRGMIDNSTDTEKTASIKEIHSLSKIV